MTDTQEMTIKFIEAYKKKRILWDPKHPHRVTKVFRDVSWMKLSVETSFTVEKCKLKARNLNNYYKRLRMKFESNRSTNKGNADIIT